MYHSQQHRMQNCQFLYLRESFGYNRDLFVCPSCGHRVAIGRIRVCVGSILAFYQIRDENRAKLKISYSCGHRVSKSARYDATLILLMRNCNPNLNDDLLIRMHQFLQISIVILIIIQVLTQYIVTSSLLLSKVYSDEVLNLLALLKVTN